MGVHISAPPAERGQRRLYQSAVAIASCEPAREEVWHFPCQLSEKGMQSSSGDEERVGHCSSHGGGSERHRRGRHVGADEASQTALAVQLGGQHRALRTRAAS